ncbi:uncharacterized protein LOC115709888 isoform X1 [Cannabis sativa]|uniref:uncharacterized protein LOC115709888 isoform X1 n=1 Tax=Cannabis sativa TaxID=3483 RepID=UPI0029C9EEEB|nr:uncharacterized protein LOC115709888 isoform X1 [Cannabis sativa]
MSNYDLSCSEQVPGVNTAADCEKAWHILAILLSIGRPASLGELSSKCELFDATPDYIGSLCSNPNSPIILLDNQLVTVSMAVVSSMVEFASKSKSGGGGGSVSLFGIEFNESNKHLNFDVKTYFRKRKEKEFDPVVFSAAKRRLLYQGENDQLMLSLPTEIKEICNNDKATVPLLLGSNCEFSKNSMMNGNQGKDEGSVGTNILDEGSAGTNIFNDSSAGTNNRDEGSAGTNILEEQQECSGYVHTSTLPCSLVNKESNLGVLEPIQEDQIMAHNYIETLPLPDNFHDSLSIKKADVDEAVGSKNGVCRSLTFDGEEDKIGNGLPLEGGFSNAHSCRSLIHHIEDVAENIAGTSGNKGVIDHHEEKGDTEKTVRFKELKNLVSISTMDKERTHRLETHTNIRVSGNSSSQKQPVKSYIKLKRMSKNLPPQQGVLLGPSKYSRLIISRKSDQKRHSGEHNSKNSNNGKENAVNPTSMSLKNNLEKKEFPQFDNFLIEDEEGSGGYGIVYRARRISDGKMCAIKCPHGKAQKHHVTNELKMLERFGGKNFIIKYEGSLKSGDAECFILEHVDHDRPEILKREIDLFQLQWYGYCMFRALACLHKQGVVHRDIKPGNFLFSRKLNKGYLIDFNLSMDLQQRLSVGSKPKQSSYASFVHAPLSSPVAAQSTKDNKAVRVHRFAVNQGGTVDLKPSHEHKNSVKRKALTDLSNFNKLKSQGADGSGITSAKDAAGARTPSAERTREPLPSLGRKELLSLVQNVMRSPNNDDDLKTSVSQRKRIAAPSCKMERKNFYTSPMPLYSNGVPVVDAALLKGKGEGKRKKEGSCVGTKGFRAPEVLLRSLHQGSKIDVWSAGVTLLYLMMGRSPFTGDPEQNMKDIAKLKGSEDLWEVAKLHDRESSFPSELLEVQFLDSMEIRSWCRAYTRRPDFFETIPTSLFDLVDKCLTVNPRLRITAEEALRHEFFASCHESLRKVRLQSSMSVCPALNI